MNKILTFLIIILSSNLVVGQFQEEKFLNAQIGLGLSAPNNSVTEIVDDGFFAQGELVMKLASWVEIRPYVGLIWTNSKGKDLNGNITDEKAESKAALLGGKARLRAPIPWIAPYVELGIGTSIGKFVTDTAFDAIEKGGVIYHISFAFGLELGRNNNVDLGLVYYFQPTVQQYAGAFAVGLTFPLK